MGFYDAVSAGIDDRADRMEAIQPIAGDFPAIAELLLGSLDASGSVNRQPGSIRIFTNAGRIKVELNGQDWIRRGFMTMPQGQMDLRVIESMIQDGKVEWVKQKKQESRFTDLPH